MRQASLEKIGLAVLGLGVWLSILVRVWTHFDPASQFASSWNSDLAIPVLQSNDPVFDPFRFYYYGQDRLGAWPWLLAQGWRALTGFDWTPYRLFLWHSTWVCAACFALLRLDQRKGGWVLAATFAALMLLSPGDQVQLMFALGQPFGWQLTAMIFAWWAFSRLIEALARPAPGRAAGGWAAGATLFATLACWTSPTSGPMLLACLGVQGILVGALSPPGRARWRLPLCVLPLAGAIGVEAILRSLFHRFSKKHFGHRYSTNLKLDSGHLWENAREIGGKLTANAPGPLVFLGWALGLLALVFLLHHLRRRTLAAHVEQANRAALTLALAAAALANTLITVMVAHVRLNDYDARYLVPTFVLGVLAAASGILFLLGQVPALHARMGMLGGVLAGALVLGGHLFVKPRIEDPSLARAQEVADLLVARAPGAVLLGGYWDSYVVGALDPQRRIPTVVLQGEYLRTPFWLPRVREASEVRVIFRRAPGDMASEPAPAWRLEYDAPFQLAEARWAEFPPFQLARYVSVREHTQPVRLEPAQGFKPCEASASLTVHFDQPFERGLLLVKSEVPPEGIEVEAPGMAEARLEAGPGLWRLHLTAGEQPPRQVTLRVRSGRETEEHCGIHGTAFVTGTPLASASP